VIDTSWELQLLDCGMESFAFYEPGSAFLSESGTLVFDTVSLRSYSGLKTLDCVHHGVLLTLILLD
jgi:hypothetical protein